MPCPGPFHFSHRVDYIYEFCPLPDPDVGPSIFVCDVEHTSFHFGLCGRKFVLCLLGQCPGLCTICHSWQHTGVVHLSLQADGKVAFEDMCIGICHQQSGDFREIIRLSSRHFSPLNMLSNVVRNSLGEMVSPCLTPLLILIFSLSLCRCTVTELSVYMSFRISMYTSSIPCSCNDVNIAWVCTESNALLINIIN